MCSIRHMEGKLFVDEVSVEHIATNVPTPFYVYSGKRIVERYNTLQSALMSYFGDEDKQPLIAYACKANSNLAILKLLACQGAGADVVTGGELSRALVSGISPNKIVFSGVGKTDSELRLAIKSDILQINVESFPELVRIGEIATEMKTAVQIAFRVNPDVDAGTHEKITTGKKENKFGIPLDEIIETYSYAKDHPWLMPQGLSIHIGSQLTNMDPYRKAFSELSTLLQQLLDHGFTINTIDVGGGLGIIYNDECEPDVNEYAHIVHQSLAHFGAQIILEPGRYIVGDAGALISKITYLKENKSSKKFLILDAGMNDLLRPALYDAFHPIQPVHIHSEEKVLVDVVGPICETGDTFAKNLNLPKVSQGDLISIGCSGAYGAVMSSNYNTRGITAEVLVFGDKYDVVRKAQSFEDIVINESVPKWI